MAVVRRRRGDDNGGGSGGGLGWAGMASKGGEYTAGWALVIGAAALAGAPVAGAFRAPVAGAPGAGRRANTSKKSESKETLLMK